jgi:Fe2+ transport system protein FeoA
MQKSESRDRDQMLSEVCIGERVLVVQVGSDADRLACHGIRPGATLDVEQDAPFGGPRIVGIGAARIAIARPLASGIVVRPAR